jgi:hypothetical protein
VAELVNLPPHPADPYVGSSAFAHKGGLHTSALGKVGGASYEHVDPALVGNRTRVLVSDLGGRAGMSMKAKEFGVELDDRGAAELSERLTDYVGYTPLHNVAGAPAMSVPLSWSPSGLPIGAMFSGKRGDDGLLFELAFELESARPWAGRRPPIAAN